MKPSTLAADLESRHARIEDILARMRAVDALALELRESLFSLWIQETPFSEQQYVCDELAVVTQESSNTTQRWLDQAWALHDSADVLALVRSGTWSLRHADAFLGELVCVAREHRDAVLALVLSGAARTPHQLRKATRAAAFVVDPEAAVERAAKARKDRHVGVYDENDGSGSLVATGPKPAVAAMLAGLDALCLPKPAGDTRTLSQRRFDTLMGLINGTIAPVGGHVQVLVHLSTLNGEDDQPAEIPGLGLITAQEARDLAAQADHLRRMVINENGELVSVDGTVERPAAPNRAETAQTGQATDTAESAQPTGLDETAETLGLDEPAEVPLSDQLEPERVVDVCEDQDLLDELPFQEWDLVRERADYARFVDPYPDKPGCHPAYDAGQALLRQVLTVAHADGRPVGQCSINLDEDGQVRLHWPEPPDPSGGLEPPAPEAPPPNSPPTQPLPAGFVDDLHAMRERDAGLELPTDPTERARTLRSQYLRRTLPSWHGQRLTVTYTDTTPARDAVPVTESDRAWHDEHDDTIAQAHAQIAEQIPLARTAATPAGGWGHPTPDASRWVDVELRRALNRMTTRTVQPPPAASSGYPFTGALARHLKARDQTCRFPGCFRLSQYCDRDHLDPWPHGATCIHNGACECKHHHQAKHAIFRLDRLPNGTLRWTLRTGHYADVPPRPVLQGW